MFHLPRLTETPNKSTLNAKSARLTAAGGMTRPGLATQARIMTADVVHDTREVVVPVLNLVGVSRFRTD